MPIAFAILSTLLGLFVSLLMVVMLFASAPNSSPEQWAQIKNWLFAVTAAAVVGLAGSVWLLIVKKPWYAMGAGAFPVLFCIVAIVLIMRSQR